MKPKCFFFILTTLWLTIGNCAVIDKNCNDFDCFYNEADDFYYRSNRMPILRSNRLTHHHHHLYNSRRSGISSSLSTFTTNPASISQFNDALYNSGKFLLKIILSTLDAQLHTPDGLTKDIAHLNHYQSWIDDYGRSLNQSIIEKQNVPVAEAVVNLFILFKEFPPEKYLQVFESCGRNDDDEQTEMLLTLVSLITSLSQKFGQLTKVVGLIKNTEIYLREYSVFNELQKMDHTTLTLENVLDYLEKNDLIRDKLDEEMRQIFLHEFVSDQIKTYLVNVIRNAKPWLKISCEHNELVTVSGNIIRLSDAFSNRTWPSTCEMEKVKKIYFAASDTTFIDYSVINHDAAKNLEDLSILSPAWVVVAGEKPRFDLTGQNGNGGAGARKCESSYGGTGADGESGSAGQNGGNFFGVVTQLQNGADLRVTASGGNGGYGGQGGEGCSGRRGSDAGWDDFPSKSNAMVKCLPNLEKPVEQHNPDTCYYGLIWPDSGWIGDGFTKTFWGFKRWFFKTGFKGGVGGTGGNGGNAGAGGIPGLAKILQLSSGLKDQVKIYNSMGIDGKPGAGGDGGLEGIRGDTYACEMYNDAFQTKWQGCYTFQNKASRFIRERTGDTGRNGNVSPLPPPPQSQPPLPWRAMNHYKRLFFGDLLRKPENSTQTFLHTLDHSPQLLPYLLPVAFADELFIIEQQHFSRGLDQTKNLVPIYNVHLQRIRDYATYRNKNESDTSSISPLSESEKAALNFVYSSAIGKLTGMRGLRNVIKVVNTTNYFEYLRNEMENLKEDKKQLVIHQESVKYRALLDGKVKESLAFIKNVALPAIDKAELTMKDEEEKMKEEMISYLNSTEEDLHKKEKALADFQSKSALRCIFGSMRVVGAIASFLGPVGEATAFGLEAISGVAQPLLLGGETSDSKLELPESVFNSPDSILLLDKIKSIEQEIGKIEEFISKNKTAFTELDKEVKKLKESVKKYKEEKENSTYLEEVKAVKALDDKRKEFKTWLEKKISSNEKDKTFSEKQITGLSWIRNILNVGTAGWDFYENVINAANNKKKSLEAAVEEAKYKVRAVEQKTEQMYGVFIPFLEKMTKHMKSNETDLSGKSQSALIVKKWEVQQMLFLMKNQVAAFTKGMKVSQQIQFSVDMLDNAMNLLIDLYNNIETYEEKKQLADYIANINSIPDAAQTAMTDPEMKNLVPKLKFSIHANLFLAKYQLALDTFKQWVFPFGDDYIADDPEITDITEFEQGKNNINMVVDKCMRKIQTLDAHLKLYRSAVVKSDSTLYTQNFTSSAVSSVPFYIWKNATWRDSIERLLAGEEINLNADLRLAEPTLYGKTAIKFKTVRIHLNVNNPHLQDELDHVLDHFHLSMIHSGVSNYQVNGKDYIMFDNPLDLRYSFESGVTVNRAIGKLDESGDFLMSPYTVWTLQLKKSGTSKDLEFSALKRFAGEVDLELAGFGSYIQDTQPQPYIISDDVENYRYYYREAADYVKNE